MRMRRLTATAIRTTTRPGRYCDGDGLYLVVKPTGAKSWVCRAQKLGSRREFGLGSVSKITLATARERAREIRVWVELGLDPIFERRRGGIPTFAEASAIVIAAQKSSWRNEKHAEQWTNTLTTYVFPFFGKTPVNEVTGPMIRSALMPIWLEKPETARRVRQRIGTVLDWAFSSGFRESEAPMRAVSKGLPRQPGKESHFAAMPYDRLKTFFVALRKRESFSRYALEFAILTAARSGEVRGATWDEFDLDQALWTIPPHRMKANREHVVPLCARAIAIVKRCAELRKPGSDLVFSGTKRGLPLSDMTLTKLLKEMKQPYTVHGFRSSFRDWVSEETDHPGEVAEAALAHLVADKTEAAYRRGKLLAKRRLMMNDWAEYCEPLAA